MLTGKLPFKQPTLKELYRQIIEGRYQLPSHLSSEATDILKKLLETEPSLRPSFAKIMDHPFVLRHGDPETRKSPGCQVP